MNSSFHRQKYLETLENCKQIPKDDRLILRKQFIDNNMKIRQLLGMKDNRKMQVKLRKYVQFMKANRKNQQIFNSIEHQANYRNTLKSLSRSKPNQFQGVYRLSADCCKKPNLQYKDCSGIQISQVSSPKKKLMKNSRTKEKKTCEKVLKSIYGENIQQKQKQQHDRAPLMKRKFDEMFIQRQNILKEHNVHQSQVSYQIYPKSTFSTPFQSRVIPNSQFIRINNNQSLFTDPKIMQECKYFLNKKTISNDTTYPTHISTHSELSEAKLQQVSQIHNKIQLKIQSQEARVRSLLLGNDSESIFDAIIVRQSSQSYKLPSCFFISYEQFLIRLNKYLLEHKNECIQKNIQQQCKYKMRYLPIFPPFNNQYQYVNLQKIVEFLNIYTITKPNPIRTLYLQLDHYFKGVISLSQFEQTNQWRGVNVIESFKRLLNKWGKWGQHITYWEMYWAKDSQQMKEFVEFYTQKY